MKNQDLGSMSLFEADAHSFVVRLWYENSEIPDANVGWRGWIDHVQSGKRHYFNNVSEINQIVSGYADIKADEADVFEPIQAEDR